MLSYRQITPEYGPKTYDQIPEIEKDSVLKISAQTISLLFISLFSISSPLHAMEQEQKSSTRKEIEQRLMPLCNQIETAFEKSDLDAMALLISQVARVSSPEEKLVILNATFKEALLKDKLDIAELLIQHKANPNYTFKDELPPLIDIARKGSALAVNFLLEAGADPEQEALVNGFKANALCAGLFNDKNYIPITEALLKKINVNCRVQAQATPLHLVASSLKRTIPMALLLEHRADPNAKDQTGGTPLDYALNASNEPRLDYKFKTILLLHVYGADITREYWQHLQHFFLNSDIARIMRERAQRESDLVCINALCTPEQQQALTFKESYKWTLGQLIANHLSALPTALANIVAEYGCYDPVIDFKLRDEPEVEKPVVMRWMRATKKKKKKRWQAAQKRCVIQ